MTTHITQIPYLHANLKNSYLILKHTQNSNHFNLTTAPENRTVKEEVKFIFFLVFCTKIIGNHCYSDANTFLTFLCWWFVCMCKFVDLKILLGQALKIRRWFKIENAHKMCWLFFNCVNTTTATSIDFQLDFVQLAFNITKILFIIQINNRIDGCYYLNSKIFHRYVNIRLDFLLTQFSVTTHLVLFMLWFSSIFLYPFNIFDIVCLIQS